MALGQTKWKSLVTIILLTLVISACGIGGSSRVGVGMEAPAIATKTLEDVGGDLGKITTYRQPDPRMYQYSLDKALATGKPVVLQFATPAHCTNCDKQLQTLKGLIDKYGERVLFLHMDQYKNAQAYKAFQVMGDPWTYIIDQQGIVRYVQSGQTLYNTLDSQLARLVTPGGKG